MAGGVNIMLLSATTAAICQLQALSPVGRCKTFDASGDGYGRGEGIALAVIMPLGTSAQSQAYHAAILGSAVNQDGRSSSLTAPNGPSQTALIQTALHVRQTRPEAVDAIAVHGTGTPLGDPIEVGALGTALASRTQGSTPPVLALLSNKSCYGHTESSAGRSPLCFKAWGGS